jgi:hypothetical protein
MAIQSQGEVCAKKDVNCREYKGSSSGNIKQIFYSDFDDGMERLWSGSAIAVSSESVNYPGKSLNCSNVGLTTLSYDVSDVISQGKNYFVSFWVKGFSDVEVKFTSTESKTKTELNSSDWQEVKLGPFYFSNSPDSAEKIQIITNTNNAGYIDNISLVEVSDSLYLIKDSWTTPEECDQNEDGDDVVGYMIGCQKYQDSQNNNKFLKSFSSICPESVVGCSAFIDTFNSSLKDQQIFNFGSDASVSVPADKIVYLIKDSKMVCAAENMGCQKFGLPDLDTESKVTDYSDVYIKNNPNNYSALLCGKESFGCEEYKGPYYFKDPGDKICEYKENVSVGTETQSGWFKKSTDQPCYVDDSGESYKMDDVRYGVKLYGENGYSGWAGECPSQQSSCSSFIDPLGKNGLLIDGFEESLGWTIDCGDANTNNGECQTINQAVPSGMEKISNEKIEGSYAQKITIQKECQEYSASKCASIDVYAYKKFSPGSLNLKPEKNYILSASAKYENSNNNDKWIIGLIEHYDKKIDEKTTSYSEYLSLDGDSLKGFEYPSRGNHYLKVNDNNPSTYISTSDGGDKAEQDIFTLSDFTKSASTNVDIRSINVIAECSSSNNIFPASVEVGLKLGNGDNCEYKTIVSLNSSDSKEINKIFLSSEEPSFSLSNINDLQVCLRGQGGSKKASLIAATKILLPDYTYKNIEDIKINDQVLSYDFSDKKLISIKVIDLNQGKKYYLTLNGNLGASLDHKIYVVDKGFIAAQDIKTGDYLLNKNLEKIKVESIEKFSDKSAVYDLVLDKVNNFFANDYLVHNEGEGEITTSSLRCSEIKVKVNYDETGSAVLLSTEIDTEEKCKARNKPNETAWQWKTDSTPYCSHAIYSGPLESSNEWQSNSVMFSIKSEDFAGLSNIQTILRGAKTTGLTVYYDKLEIKSFDQYYYLDNSNLDQSSCSAVSLKQGCVLLYSANENNGAKTWNAQATYVKSQNNNAGYVNPVDCSLNNIDCVSQDSGDKDKDYCLYCYAIGQNANDVNMIVKAKQDRICGEWLSCNSWRLVWDSASGKYQQECQTVSRCDKLVGTGETNRCGHTVYEKFLDSDNSETVLNEEGYKNRDVSWSGLDYSGHSLYGFYPIENLYIENGKLTYSQNGVDGESTVIPKTCRAFPEKDSPFKQSSEKEYPQVNVCGDNNSRSYPNCQCSYQKIEYGDGSVVKYYSQDNKNTPTGICLGGGIGVSGVSCSKDSDCKNGDKVGECAYKSKVTEFNGLRGFCLESSIVVAGGKSIDSNECITWLPGMGIGDTDIYNFYTSAGYTAENGAARWYCNSKNNKPINSYDFNANAITGVAEGYSETGTSETLAIDSKLDQYLKSNQITQDKIDYIKIRLGVGDEGTIDENIRQSIEAISPTSFSIIGCVFGSKYGCVKENTTNGCYYDCTKITCSGTNATIIYSVKAADIILQESLNTENCSHGSWAGVITEDSEGGDSYDWTNEKCVGDKGAACLKAEAIFSDNNYLSLIKITKSDTTDNENSFYYSKTNNVANIEVVLKNVCDSFSEIPYSSGIIPGAWTDKLWAGSTSRVGGFTYLDSPDCIAPYRAGRLNINDGNKRLVFYKENLDNLECQDNEVYGTMSQENLKTLLFTKFDNYTLTTPNNNNYSNSYSSPTPIIDVSNPHLADTVVSPQTASVIKTGDEYAIGPKLNTIGIGTQSAGEIKASQSYEANLMFYAWADKNAMPIREIAIDWFGDGTKVDKYEVMAKNHKPNCCLDNNNCIKLSCAEENCAESLGSVEYIKIYGSECNSGECTANNFGNIPDACEQGFFQFNYVFSCNGVGSLGWEEHGCDNACCFIPKVYIKDNWGWCNGGTSGAGVYAVDSSGNPKSCTTTSGAGVSYDGKIKVTP